jgi:hypothetical protein
MMFLNAAIDQQLVSVTSLTSRVSIKFPEEAVYDIVS